MCFLDIEMTDPDSRKARIAEIAVYLLSGDLRQQYRVASMVITNASSSEALEAIVTNDYVKARFKKNGLWEEMCDPIRSRELHEAEALIIC